MYYGLIKIQDTFLFQPVWYPFLISLKFELL